MRDMYRIVGLCAVLALSLLSGVTGISEVHAQDRENIYIRANGAIECTDPGYTVPIVTTDNTTYTFTGDIGTTYAITVERDHIVLDGSDFTLAGSVVSGSDFRDFVYLHQRGIDLLGRRNVTVRNLHITHFETAIYNQCINTTIRGVHCTSALYGIVLGFSNYATIIGNQFLNVTRPISLHTMSGDHHYTISHNTLIGPMVGIELLDLSSSVIRENQILATSWGYGAQGMGFSMCSENTITGNSIVNMSYFGMVLTGSSNNTIADNEIRENDQYGIQFVEWFPYTSSHNLVRDNHIAGHNGHGIVIGASCEFNTFYHNTIEENGAWYSGVQVSVAEGAFNRWDNGSRGNYWSDYTGLDVTGDGIGDTPYEIDDLNRDHYPLTTNVRTSTTITCAISPSELSAYSTLTIDGAITPSVGAVPVTLTFVQPDSTTVTVPVTSHADSVYYTTYTPTSGGAWSVSASWAGDDMYDGAISTSTMFTVTPLGLIPTSLILTTPVDRYCEDADVVIEGSVIQATDGTPLSGVPVTLTGIGHALLTKVVITDSNGNYQHVTQYSTAGDEEKTIVASWDGNTTHLGDSAEVIITILDKNFAGFCCFIATATYGSAMAPEVQFLRDFRAATVLTTFTGRQFMAVFNGIYYSFSPKVASGIASNEGLRTVARGVLFPLIRILQVGEWVTQRFTVSPDLGIVAFVLVVSALLSLVYLMPWALLFSAWRRYTLPARVVRRSRDLLMGSVGLLLLAIAFRVPVLTMAGGTLTVLLTAGFTTVAATRVIMRRLIAL